MNDFTSKIHFILSSFIFISLIVGFTILLSLFSSENGYWWLSIVSFLTFIVLFLSPIGAWMILLLKSPYKGLIRRYIWSILSAYSTTSLMYLVTRTIMGMILFFIYYYWIIVYVQPFEYTGPVNDFRDFSIWVIPYVFFSLFVSLHFVGYWYIGYKIFVHSFSTHEIEKERSLITLAVSMTSVIATAAIESLEFSLLMITDLSFNIVPYRTNAIKEAGGSYFLYLPYFLENYFITFIFFLSMCFFGFSFVFNAHRDSNRKQKAITNCLLVILLFICLIIYRFNWIYFYYFFLDEYIWITLGTTCIPLIFLITLIGLAVYAIVKLKRSNSFETFNDLTSDNF